MAASRLRLLALMAVFAITLPGCASTNGPTSGGASAAPSSTGTFIPVTDSVAFELTASQVAEMKDKCSDATGSLNNSEICLSSYVEKNLHRQGRCRVNVICITIAVKRNDPELASLTLTDSRPGNPLCSADRTHLCAGITVPAKNVIPFGVPSVASSLAPPVVSGSASASSSTPTRPGSGQSTATPSAAHPSTRRNAGTSTPPS